MLFAFVMPTDGSGPAFSLTPCQADEISLTMPFQNGTRAVTPIYLYSMTKIAT
jgi:hypothetical protein